MKEPNSETREQFSSVEEANKAEGMEGIKLFGKEELVERFGHNFLLLAMPIKIAQKEEAFGLVAPLQIVVHLEPDELDGTEYQKTVVLERFKQHLREAVERFTKESMERLEQAVFNTALNALKELKGEETLEELKRAFEDDKD